MAERQPSKLHVASSNLVSRSTDSPAAPPTAPERLAAAGRHLRTTTAAIVRVDSELRDAAAALSERYRSGPVPGAIRPVRDARTATAYAVARAPATFAAAGRAMLEAALSLPDLAPATLLDIGAGTGAAAWAATAVWPSLADVTLVERDPAMVSMGRTLAGGRDVPSALAGASWRTASLGRAPFEPADVVTAAYVLGELPVTEAASVVQRAWAATRGALVIVEPGSPAGFARVIAARTTLIAQGAAIAAPCPGNLPCPVVGADWCHFLVRLERSRAHQAAKAGTLAWEDEPFSYVVATRLAPAAAPRVVLGRPRHRPGRVELRVCVAAGRIVERTLSRRDGAEFRAARDLAWGDRIPAPLVERVDPTPRRR
ncbi:MAG: hypothetical protein QOF49_1180 [Chloroflexota bacterium]|nr:hypothetical protein [Chloroflexota bacterium]